MPSSKVFIDMERGRGFVDRRGEIFGRLTIVDYAGRWGNNLRKWKCKCKCGNEVITALKGAQSCGCLNREEKQSRATHGHTGTKTYSAWKSMRRRCTNEKSIHFKNYGGRGIKVCERWAHSFEAFLSDMGTAPERCTLDRINNDGNYEPSNCRWATKREQDNNRRTNVFITFNHTTQTIRQWCRALGYSDTLLKGRFKLGWSVERALTEPARQRKVVQ